MKKLTFTCPNCGAPLRHDGYCEYCDTQIRYENEIEVLGSALINSDPIEILVKCKKEKGTCYTLLEGTIESVRNTSEEQVFYYDDTPVLTMREPEYEIVFKAHLSGEKIGVE